MLRAVRKIPLRRCLYTQAPAARQAQQRRLAFAGAASALAVTYFVWRVSSATDIIALDSHHQPATPVSSGPSTLKPEAHIDVEPELQPDASLPPEPSNEAQDDENSEEGPAAAGSAAFNPETGEINWDCPCLGGMAHGPCGLQFREAFSCFVFSEQDPKGIDCVEKFKAMQDCFREHPDVYGEEIMDDDEDGEQPSDPELTTTTLTKESSSEFSDTPSAEGTKLKEP